MDLDLKGLLRKLNRTCTRSLETAAGLCVSRTQYEVTVKHLLLVLLEDTGADVQAVLHHFGVEPGTVARVVQRTLESQRSGNTGRPVFSPAAGVVGAGLLAAGLRALRWGTRRWRSSGATNWMTS